MSQYTENAPSNIRAAQGQVAQGQAVSSTSVDGRTIKPPTGKLLKGGLLFLALASLTLWLLLKEYSLPQLLAAVKNVDMRFLPVAAFAMGLFLLCEGKNIATGLAMAGRPIGLRQMGRYAMGGYFFSSVTPSASGGQPMQLYFMYKDGIAPSHGSLALLLELTSFQIVSISMALFGLVYTYVHQMAMMTEIKYLLFLGLGLNLALLLILLAALFSTALLKGGLHFVLIILGRLIPAKAPTHRRKLLVFAASYGRAATHLKKHPAVFLKLLATSTVQLLAFHSIPYLIYLCFGLTGYEWLEIFSLQALLYVSVSALPLPGAVGVTEGGFAVVFQQVFPPPLLGAALILCRLISFYLPLMASGLGLIWLSFSSDSK